MNSCKNCGTPLLSGAKYCHNCGNVSRDISSGIPYMPGVYHGQKNQFSKETESGQNQKRFFNSSIDRHKKQSRKTWILLTIAASAIIAIAIIIYILTLYKGN